MLAIKNSKWHEFCQTFKDFGFSLKPNGYISAEDIDILIQTRKIVRINHFGDMGALIKLFENNFLENV